MEISPKLKGTKSIHPSDGRIASTPFITAPTAYPTLNATTTASQNLAIGDGAVAGSTTGGGNIAIGNNTTVGGFGARATGTSGVAIGTSAIANGTNSTAVGSAANASTNISSVAIGASASTGNDNTIAIGVSASASAQWATVVGKSAASGGSNSVGVGYAVNIGSANGAVALGSSTGISSANSIAIGYATSTKLGATNAVAIGYSALVGDNISKGVESISIGNSANSQANYDVVIGSNASATADKAIAIGGGTSSTDAARALAIGSIAIGNTSLTTASADNSIALGFSAKIQSSSAYAGIAIGYQVQVYGGNSTAIGRGCSIATTSNSYSSAIGNNNSISGTASISTALGINASVTAGTGSLAIGLPANGTGTTTVSNTACVAIGNYLATDQTGEYAFGSGTFTGAANGTAKNSFCQLIAETTDAVPLQISVANGAASNPGSRIALTDDSTYLFDIDLVARNTTDDTQSAVWNLKFGIRRGASAATTTLIGTPTKTIFGMDTGTTSWDVNVTADTTQGRPNISVTGETGKTIRWGGICRMSKITG